MSEQVQVPYIVHEGSMARMERTIKRLFILLIVSVAITLVTNLAWLYYWNQYEYVVETESYSYEQDGQGFNLIGDRNHIGTEVFGNEDSEESEEEGWEFEGN